MGLNRLSIVVIIVLLQVWWCDGCWMQERNALLQLKSFLNYPNFTSLSSWGIETDCCRWKGVECSFATQRVSKIFLSRTRSFGSGDWYLNASLFLPFEELNVLLLDGNQIAGCVENEGFERLSRLGNLERLDLSDNVFNHSNILSSLSEISSLKSLYLYNVGLKGIIDVQDLNNLSSLKLLDMGGNEIEGFKSFPDARGLTNMRIVLLDDITRNGRSISLKTLAAFPFVKTFYLRGNNIEGKISAPELDNLTNVEELFLDYSSLVNNSSFLQTIGSLRSLKTLSLSSSGFTGTLPSSQGLCQLRYLQELDISYNDLSGTLPWCLANLTSLQVLNLCSNHFTGNISSSPLKNLVSINQLLLSDNNFRIPFSLLSFFNHSKLKILDMQRNEIVAEPEVHYLIPKFQLKSLVFSGHGYGGAFPNFLYHQNDLKFVEISHIKMTGGFPYWLVENNTKLQRLNLVNDTLSGPLDLPIRPHIHLSDLDISNNYFYGYIPAEIAELPKLTSLNMSGNGFEGSIPSSFGNMSTLEILDLSNNGLSNEIPEQLTMGCFSLHFLILSNNKLQGQIFSGNVNLTDLWWLLLDNNQFSGSIPDSLANCSSLTRLYVNNNELSGRIPGWMGSMSFLVVLDLSENNLSGFLPSNFSPLQMQQVYLSRNKLRGSLDDAFYNCSELMTLDLSHNCLTGRIPEWIGRLSQLSYLLLNHNNLQGEIPIQLCKLDQLSLIDLSHNNLSGRILACLKFNSEWNRNQEIVSAPSPDPMQQPLEFTTKSVSHSYQESILTFLSGIDLSCNNLTGQIPGEIGNLGSIQVLNLSHNSLTGKIPSTFSNLKQIESMDLSYNKLEGKIPPQLVVLNFLSVFIVANNNLSGKIPERVAQFATFDKNSYEGNPFLCGIPLQNSCKPTVSSSSMPNDKEESGCSIDMNVFYVSFIVSYSIVLLGILAVVCINPSWRRAWFYFVELSINHCYYFIGDNVPFFSKFR